MSAVMLFRWISRCSTSTASSPPNVRRMPWATRIGSGFVAPGTGRIAGASALVTEHDLLSRSEYALWSEDHQQHDQQPDQHESQRADVLRFEHVVEAEEPALDRLPQERLARGDQEPQQDRTDDRPEDARESAEDQCRVREERE